MCATQSKEVERLNGVYNKLLKNAGVEMIGAASSSPSCIICCTGHRTPKHAPVRDLHYMMLLGQRCRRQRGEVSS